LLYIRNIYKEGELDENRTCNYYLQVQNEGGREVERKIKFFFATVQNKLLYAVTGQFV